MQKEKLWTDGEEDKEVEEEEKNVAEFIMYTYSVPHNLKWRRKKTSTICIHSKERHIMCNAGITTVFFFFLFIWLK